MKTVKEVSRSTGVSIRTLHHYDAIGLLKPSCGTDAGYRLYDDAALERLQLILIYRELGLPLKEIGRLLDEGDPDRNRVLQHQIRLMRQRIDHLQKRISFAQGMLNIGVNDMELKEFDHQKMDDYSAQARALYGKTDAYKEYSRKSQGRSREQEQDLGSRVMDFFARLGSMRGEDPTGEAAKNWAAELRTFLTEHYYNCTPEIFRCLAESYADGGSMNENIDKAGGPGTGAFAKAAIHAYLDAL